MAAKIYVRLPHYIASYLRNRDENNILQQGEAIRLSSGDPLSSYIQFHATANLHNAINMDCLSESQWNLMRKGKMLCFPRNGLPMDIARKYNKPLQLFEIYTLCDMPKLVKTGTDGEYLPDTSYNEEYVPFLLPKRLFRGGKEVEVQSDYFLPDATPFINELRQRFRIEIIDFIAKDRASLQSAELNTGMRMGRSNMESIDRFMVRYDIRPGNKEREQMKKVFYRARGANCSMYFTDHNHGYWTAEREKLAKQNATSNVLMKKRAVVCETTGIEYDSISAFARAYNVRNHAQIINAIKNHWRIHGVYVRYSQEIQTSNQ